GSPEDHLLGESFPFMAHQMEIMTEEHDAVAGGHSRHGKPITKVDDVRVIWNGGREESFGPMEAGAYHTLIRGRGEAIEQE
ncbi:MAG: hypothetical protein KDB61_09095, partial [Planctomycetes bacterium]|nr:hypothetical protein [Planctomycetota bacterium]